MNIVFYCQSCGARFEVPSTSGGKRGRCRKCGQIMSIPHATELASMVAMPALAAADVGRGPQGDAQPRRETVAKGTVSWLASVNSSVGLAPLTVDRLPIGTKKSSRPKIDDDLGDSKPYKLDEPIQRTRGVASKPVSGIKMLWRKELGFVQKFFRWLNETAYLISVPFLMLIVLGTVVRSRPLALLGATVVILLNVGRIVAGLANLLVIPFREGISQGIMFLIPPLTFVYMKNHWKKLKKPTMRVVWPAITIVLVILAFTFLPGLHKGGRASGDLKAQLVEGAKSLGEDMRSEVEKAKAIDLQKLENQAEGKLHQLQENVGGSSKKP
jgi:hypothetical protein